MSYVKRIELRRIHIVYSAQLGPSLPGAQLRRSRALWQSSKVKVAVKMAAGKNVGEKFRRKVVLF